MGVQTSNSLLTNKRIPMARGSHGPLYLQRGWQNGFRYSRPLQASLCRTPSNSSDL